MRPSSLRLPTMAPASSFATRPCARGGLGRRYHHHHTTTTPPPSLWLFTRLLPHRTPSGSASPSFSSSSHSITNGGRTRFLSSASFATPALPSLHAASTSSEPRPSLYTNGSTSPSPPPSSYATKATATATADPTPPRLPISPPTLEPWTDIPEPDYNTLGPTSKLNLFTSINSALDAALQSDPTAIVFGEDVGFGGVFRCSVGLRDKHGPDRVFNTPLSECGIVGFAAGYAAQSGTAVAEIQFADYIFPALDQLVNEVSKFRYRSGNQWSVGRLTVRAPCGAVGHGGHYHSQSPEAYLAHTPGLVVVMPRGPRSAKGLLLRSIRCEDPVVFLEPKALYRAAVEDVPDAEYEIPLGKAEIMRQGTDVTLVGWGGHLRVMEKACDMAASEYGISSELIDLRTILPWDVECVTRSVLKTGKLLVSHEAPITSGFGAEVVATVQGECFFSLEAPVERICGYDTPFPLAFEKYYVPDELKILDGIKRAMENAK